MLQADLFGLTIILALSLAWNKVWLIFICIKYLYGLFSDQANSAPNTEGCKSGTWPGYLDNSIVINT